MCVCLYVVHVLCRRCTSCQRPTLDWQWSFWWEIKCRGRQYCWICGGLFCLFWGFYIRSMCVCGPFVFYWSPVGQLFSFLAIMSHLSLRNEHTEEKEKGKLSQKWLGYGLDRRVVRPRHGPFTCMSEPCSNVAVFSYNRPKGSGKRADGTRKREREKGMEEKEEEMTFILWEKEKQKLMYIYI